MNDYISELAERFGVALAEASENAGAVETRGDASAVGKYSPRDKIVAGMTDYERAEILKEKTIFAKKYIGQADSQIDVNIENLESKMKSLVSSALKNAKKAFDIPMEIVNQDYDIVVKTTSGLFGESASKEITDAKQLVKLMPLLTSAVNGAVAIESHSNRYFFDNDTVYFLSLLGGYIDNGSFVPIRFGIKQSVMGKNYLYVVIDNEAIKIAEVSAEPHVVNDRRTSTDSAEISITKVLRKVNNPDILRYVPDSFLDDGRKVKKYDAIAKTIKKTNDKNDRKYYEFIRAGNLQAAKEMVKRAAISKGYTTHVYHGTNAVFTTFKYGDIGFHAGTKAQARDRANQSETNGRVMELYGEMENPLRIAADFGDWHGNNAAEMLIEYEVFEGDNTINQELLKIARMDNEEESDVALREYLKSLGFDGIMYENRFEDMSGRANDNSGDSYIFFDPSQLKSADPITYDDKGNIVPLSERFNEQNDDIRFSMRDSSAGLTKEEAREQARAYTKLKARNAKLEKQVKELKRELDARLAKYKAGVKENQAQSKYRTLNGESLYCHAA